MRKNTGVCNGFQRNSCSLIFNLTQTALVSVHFTIELGDEIVAQLRPVGYGVCPSGLINSLQCSNRNFQLGVQDLSYKIPQSLGTALAGACLCSPGGRLHTPVLLHRGCAPSTAAKGRNTSLCRLWWSWPTSSNPWDGSILSCPGLGRGDEPGWLRCSRLCRQACHGMVAWAGTSHMCLSIKRMWQESNLETGTLRTFAYSCVLRS